MSFVRVYQSKITIENAFNQDLSGPKGNKKSEDDEGTPFWVHL